MEETSLNDFRIQCLKCNKEGKPHDTMIYVQWKKKYYMMICYTCGTTEAFDEFGKKLNLKEKKN